MEYVDFKNFADLMSYYRAYEDLTQEQLAIKAHLSRVSISNIENGGHASLNTKIKIMKALNVPEHIIADFVKYN